MYTHGHKQLIMKCTFYSVTVNRFLKVIFGGGDGAAAELNNDDNNN